MFQCLNAMKLSLLSSSFPFLLTIYSFNSNRFMNLVISTDQLKCPRGTGIRKVFPWNGDRKGFHVPDQCLLGVSLTLANLGNDHEFISKGIHSIRMSDFGEAQSKAMRAHVQNGQYHTIVESRNS